jgi:hypothetical protein
MPFSPNSSLYSKSYPRNINYMHPKGTYFVAPAVFFSYASILEKIAILGQPPSPSVSGGYFAPYHRFRAQDLCITTFAIVHTPTTYLISRSYVKHRL